MFVIDSSDRKRLQETADELAQLLQARLNQSCSFFAHMLLDLTSLHAAIAADAEVLAASCTRRVDNVSINLLAGGQDARSTPCSPGKQAGSHQCIASCRGKMKPGALQQ